MQNTGPIDLRAHADNGTKRTQGDKVIVRSALFSLICLILSLSLPLLVSMPELARILSLPFSLSAGAVLIYSLRKVSAIAVLTLAFVFLTSYTGSLALPTLILSTAVLCGVYYALVSEIAKPFASVMISLTPIASCAAAFALTGEAVISLLPLAFFLPAAVMGLVTRRGGSRSSAISAFAAVCAAEIALIAVAHIYIQNRAISAVLIGSSADYLQSQIILILENAILRAGNVELSEDIISQISLTSQEIVNCLTGITVAVLLAVGYFAQKLGCSLFERFEFESLQNKAGEQIRGSAASALVYLFAHICSFTSGASGTVSFFSVAATNISLILLPLMLCVGGEFLLSLPRKIGFLAILIWGGAILLSMLLSGSIINILALTGCFYTVITSVDIWAKEHYSKGEDQ